MADRVQAGVFEYFVDTHDGRKKLDDLSQGHKKVTETAQEAETPVSGLSAAMGRLGGAAAAVAVALGAFRILQASVGVFAQYELAAVRLGAALERAGMHGEDAKEQYQGFVRELAFGSNATVQQINNYLALATSFGVTGEAARNLVRAGLDLAAATGTDMDAAVRNLALSLRGVRNETLQVIPGVQSLTQEQLKAGAAVDLAAKAFGGAALRETKTLAGATNNLETAFEEVQASLGAFVADLAQLREIAEYATGALGGLNEQLKNIRGLNDAEKAMLSFDDALRKVIVQSGLGQSEYAAFVDTYVNEARRAGVTEERLIELARLASLTNKDAAFALRSLIAVETEYATNMRAAQSALDKRLASVQKELAARKELATLDQINAEMGAEIMSIPGPEADFTSLFSEEMTTAVDAYNFAISETEGEFQRVAQATNDASAAIEKYMDTTALLSDSENQKAIALDTTQYKLKATRDAQTALTEASAMAAAQAITSALVYGRSAKEAAKAALASLAAQAIGEALFQTAKGFAALALGQGALAAYHFTSAKIFGAVGIAAGVAARGLGSASGGGGGGSAAGGVESGAAADTAPPVQSRSQEITIILEGQGFIQDQDSFARSLAEAMGRQNNRAGL